MPNLNTGLTAEQVLEAFYRALHDLTDEQIMALLAEKQNTLTFDNSPTSDSDNPVKSKGIKTYVDTAVSDKIEISDVFGAGTAIPDTADLNTYQTAGAYTRDSTSNAGITNAPSVVMGASTYGFKLTVEYVSNYERLIQKLYPSWNQCVYFVRQRYKNPNPDEAAAWSVWKPITPFGSLGTKITTATAITSLDPGFYYCVDTSLLSGLPSNYTATNAIIEVTTTFKSTRQRIKLYAGNTADAFWVKAESSDNNTWTSWYMYSGTAVT